MPTRTRKRKASEDEGVEVEEAPQPAKKTGRATQRKPSIGEAQSSRSGSSKRGRAGLSNLTAGNASKTSKSASSSARSAKSEIRRSADDLIHLIEDQFNNARSGIARSSSLSSKNTVILQGSIDTQNIVYHKSHDRIKTLQDAINEYEIANRDSLNIRKPAEGAQWEQDAKDAFKVNKKATEILIQTLNGLVISGGDVNPLRSPPRSNDDIERAAWRWVQGGIPPSEDTWGSSARDTLRAFAEISKLLL